MKREGLKKKKCTIHGHDRCGICRGNYRTKGGVRQKVKNELRKLRYVKNEM